MAEKVGLILADNLKIHVDGSFYTWCSLAKVVLALLLEIVMDRSI